MKIILIALLVALFYLYGSQAKISIMSEKIGNKTYYISYNDKQNWTNASQKCKDMHAVLADLEVMAELNAISERMPDTNYWIGINDREQTGNYVVNGKRATFFHWHFGEPNNAGGNEHCVELQRIGSKTAMNDNGCGTNLNYICEI